MDIVVDVDYDGDSESVVVDRRIERGMSGDKMIGTTETFLPRGDVCDPPPLTPLPKNDVHSDRSRASISAAITVSKLQATFAEKTAADMEQIVNWYNRYGDDERFVKVSQSDSLPDNSIVYDSLHSHYPAGNNLNDPNETSDDRNIITESSPSQSFSSDSSWVTPTSSPTTSTTISDIAGGDPSSSSNTPVRSNRIASSSSSLSPSVCSEEVRRQLERVDHLIRVTQYMAEVVVDLEHSSSSSSDKENTVDGTSNLRDMGLEERATAAMEEPIEALTRNCVIDPPEIVRKTHSTNPSTSTKGINRPFRHSYPMAKTIALWIILPLLLSTLMLTFLWKEDLSSVLPDDETEIPITTIKPDVLETIVFVP